MDSEPVAHGFFDGFRARLSEFVFLFVEAEVEDFLGSPLIGDGVEGVGDGAGLGSAAVGIGGKGREPGDDVREVVCVRLDVGVERAGQLGAHRGFTGHGVECSPFLGRAR